MKVITALMAMAVSASALPNDPGDTALRFLEKVRDRKINLDPGGDTALAPQTSGQKRQEIARRLERMARDLGSDPLEVGPVKLDDDLAAVLVRKIGGFDPGRLRIFPIALVKRGSGWAVAPVPASFENAGLGYAAAIRARLGSLEDWMLREQVNDLDKLREQSADRMRREIGASLPVAELAKLGPSQVVDRFLVACAKHRLPEILGLLGGLSKVLPDDWPQRIRTAESALASAGEGPRPWHLMAAPEVLRVPVYQEEDGDTALVSIACLDPAGNPPKTTIPKVEILNLNLTRTVEHYWRLDPPPDNISEPEAHDNGSEPDKDLLDLFPSKLALKYPPSARESAVQARDALLAAFGKPELSAWLSLIQTAGDPPESRSAIVRAAQTWWEFANPASGRHAIPIAFHEEGIRAASACQIFDARNPDRMDLKFFFFSRQAAGWLWDPSPGEETRKSLEKWMTDQVNTAPVNWQALVLSECPEIENVAANPPPPEEASKLVESWLSIIRTGDIKAALRLTARLKTPDSNASLLRNLGYEISGARRNKQQPSITEATSGKACTAVGVRTSPDDKPAFPLYPVVSTPSGPRILLEIDLLASDSRSRDFLNKAALERLRKTDALAADDLAKLLAAHQAGFFKTNGR